MPVQHGIRPDQPAPPDVENVAGPLAEVINRLRRALRTAIRTDFPWETLPAAQVELPQTLQDRTEVRVSDVATALHLAPSTVSGLFGQILSTGLAERDTDPADRRAARFRLTDSGAARLAGWQEAHERRIASALASLIRATSRRSTRPCRLSRS